MFRSRKFDADQFEKMGLTYKFSYFILDDKKKNYTVFIPSDLKY